LSRGLRRILATVRRLPPILLLVAFVALGSGLLEDLHLRTHLRERAAQAVAAKPGSPAADQSAHDPADDASGCELCAHLHLPRVSTGWVPVLVCLGLFVAFLSQLTPRLDAQRVIFRPDCRGPPAF
jgi:hypothetical protein